MSVIIEQIKIGCRKITLFFVLKLELSVIDCMLVPAAELVFGPFRWTLLVGVWMSVLSKLFTEQT